YQCTIWGCKNGVTGRQQPCPPHSATSGGCTLHSPSAQPLPGWTLQSELLMREAGTCFLLCACVCAWLGLGVPVLGDRGGPGPGAFTCHNNNILRIECRWPGPALGQGAGSWLLFTSTSVSSGLACAPWSCRPRRSSCLLTTSPSPSTATSPGRSKSAWWIHSICPGDMSNISSEHCVLTWSISPALEPLATLLSYELAFKRQEEAWEWAWHKEHIVGVTWLKLEATELDPGSAYEARLRVQMAALEGEVAEEERYEGVWSDWSQPACFATPPRRGRLVPALGQSDSTLVAVSLFLLLSSLTYLLFKLSPRWVARDVCESMCLCPCDCVCVCRGMGSTVC
uniref:Interleukin 9 receptor n=1 Tax=Moschus moschiferus TaxID=68415 RepID=A0A8C6CP23_MOSMO